MRLLLAEDEKELSNALVVILKHSNYSVDAVYEVTQGFQSVANSQGKTLTADIEKELSYCGDESTIRQLVSLLLDNAMKYSDDNGKIAISLKSNGKGRVITVTNSVEKSKGVNTMSFLKDFIVPIRQEILRQAVMA